MKITIDTDNALIVSDDAGKRTEVPLYSKEGFELITHWWVKVGWNEKYPYAFSWMGRPIIQMPEDMIRTQEVIYNVRPDVIVETGVAHGGSLIYYASLMKAFGIEGKVIGIDIEIRPHNRKAIEAHELFDPYITLVEGSSIDAQIVDQVHTMVKPQEQKILVILDSCHTKAHVAAELEAYHDLVSVDSYIVATDGSMKDLHDVPRGNPEWVWDHPTAAAAEFVEKHEAFVVEQPQWPFNESELEHNITHWPGAWVRRVR